MWAAAESEYRDLLWLLFRWRDFSNIKSVREWVRGHISDPQRLPYILRGCSGRSTMNGKVVCEYAWTMEDMMTLLPHEEWLALRKAPWSAAQARGRGSHSVGRGSQVGGRLTHLVGKLTHLIGRGSQATGRLAHFIGRLTHFIGRVAQMGGRVSQATGREARMGGKVSHFAGCASHFFGQRPQHYEKRI